ncbi:molecular chaperone GrpE [Natronocella acetinitrilica]|jgi:molecular chaperone GrpE|uniref:Protein GrpE n=1 Tax=Natronocella acetinitrilica TaxID=414046 RepID=A0AAE3KBS3_9GAMM|nr:nucleotide exchange factor GrpE [Natronocella acetinitrilica]MCP1676010.1 molecular chaperone GrpE [Natronocella acetinitrilica]
MAEQEDKRHATPTQDEAAPETGEAAKPDSDAGQLQALQAELEAAQTKAEDNWNEYLRARAEIENVRRRMERDVDQARKFGVEKMAHEMLAVKDSLEMGLAAAREANADVGKLTEGTELTLKMMNQALEKFSIAEVNPAGQKFNPEEHEAMAMQPSAEHEPNTVIHVVQKGYRLSDRLLRPAMVIVSRPADQQQGGHIDEQA